MTKAGLAQEVKTRPIIFGAESVRAILEGRKTQTRRVIKPQPRPTHYKPCQGCKDGGQVVWHFFNEHLSSDTDARTCPYGKRRERLWVRETVMPVCEESAQGYPRGVWAYYKADRTQVDGNHVITSHISPMHLPRAWSRITLELIEVRVERLQKITLGDCRAEGVSVNGSRALRHGALNLADKYFNQYREVWDALNAKRGFPWQSNPFVWVLTFRRVQDTRA